jgi:hypothetical protein
MDLNLNRSSIDKILDDGTKISEPALEIVSSWSGFGIVTLSGGKRYLLNTYMNIRYIREKLNSKIPIEIWYLKEEEINNMFFTEICKLGNVFFVNATEKKKKYPMRLATLKKINSLGISSMEGWRTKSYAIFHSRFSDVIFLDGDCFLYSSPSDVFGSKEYLETGAVFSADLDTNYEVTGRNADPETFLVKTLGSFSKGIWDYSKPNPIWSILKIQEDNLPEFESGFMVINKVFHWRPLLTTLFLNDHSDFVYKYIFGDKDTFHLAWAKHNAKCFVRTNIKATEGGFLGMDNESPVYEHRVFKTKFSFSVGWDVFPNIPNAVNPQCFKSYFEQAKKFIKRFKML